MEQSQAQGLRNFAVNIKPTMAQIHEAINQGQSKPAKLDYHAQYSIFQFYLEVCDYLSKVE